jgi:Fic family protein
MQVVSGPIGRERVHFEAPDPERVEHEMLAFLDWYAMTVASDLDPILKAAVAHLWFVTIHPFDDGNGRIGRALIDHTLARAENSPQRFYSLSSEIQKNTKGYYAILEGTQKGDLNITPWLTWFIDCYEGAIQGAHMALDVIFHKAAFWQSLCDKHINERQKKMINLLLDGFEGKLTTSKYAKITKCSQDTAYRDILDLIEQEVLSKNIEGGRSSSYSLVPLSFI